VKKPGFLPTLDWLSVNTHTGTGNVPYAFYMITVTGSLKILAIKAIKKNNLLP
jgi:hypothetical protein